MPGVGHVADLPSAGRKVCLRLLMRRFACEVPHCRRRIFAERFGEDVVPLRQTRTWRGRSRTIALWLKRSPRGRRGDRVDARKLEPRPGGPIH
ncbi:hypothetical protein BSZ19_35990 [Bradyrhizobium japonicum]|uniref:Transposase n=1 Tax=Bradyrhizobium japonicum TaxID=375 RepID=A0A1Y2JFY5_BRAJP|nr:hypothetical protein BSZ19_35990 [Bradyrhizobium japonicum]